MKGEEEDDDAKPKPVNESTQLIDWSAHVEKEQQPKLCWLSVDASEGSGVFIGAYLQFYYMSRPFSERSFSLIPVVFEIFMYKFPLRR